MNRRMGALVLLFAVLTLVGCMSAENLRKGPARALSATNSELIVMSFNVRMAHGVEDWGRTPYYLKYGQNLDAVIEAIRSADPDIVGLQEVAGTGQARKIAEALNMNYAFAYHPSPRGGRWGVALLSRFPITTSKGRNISSGVGNSKSIIVAQLRSGIGPIIAASIHKDKDLSDGSSTNNILDAVANAPGPVLLIGDFNLSVDSGPLKPILKRFIDPVEAVDTAGAKRVRRVGTFGVAFWGIGGRIDHVFPEKGRFIVIDVDLVAKEHWRASDHVAVFTRLRLNPKR